MAAKTYHFRAGNGDMTLLELESGRLVLIDINIRDAACDPNDQTPDVLGQLREILEKRGRDEFGRLYVDAFLLTHPDQDHCRGLAAYFHLGSLSEWSESSDKIAIGEMWSSPIVFRRRGRNHSLCADAQAWATEARRRANQIKGGQTPFDGDRIQILGEDVSGKIDERLRPYVVEVGDVITTINGGYDLSFRGLLIAPKGPTDSEDEEDQLSKNNSSVVMRISLSADWNPEAARYLFGGDAEVAIWERIWARTSIHDLEYDVLIAPHHCSWRSLSHHSYSIYGEDALVSEGAKDALSQARKGARVLASSRTITSEDSDPPSHRAKREYAGIVGSKQFHCLADFPGTRPVVFEIDRDGPRLGIIKAAAVFGTGTTLGTEAYAHG